MSIPVGVALRLLAPTAASVIAVSIATVTRAEDWTADWAVADGFSLSIDAHGFRYPTSIAFVPEPGNDPKDPLYFVTELRGAVKVVTNDRSVLTFADDFFDLDLGFELPDMRAEAGLGAVCLEPEHGYVFVSFAYQDAGGEMHNDIVRFRTTPRTFSVKPVERVAFTKVFDDFPSSRSHQIGHMAVDDGLLYVAVGDALHSAAGRDLDTVLGKVLRMTLDGEPVPHNPFYAGGGTESPRSYVWAYGLRNPFGLVGVGPRMFAAENGPSVDRFLVVERGRDYGYDGSDWSMGLNAAAVFAPSVGPAQVAWHGPHDSALPPEYRNAFYIAFGGSVWVPHGEGMRGERSVVRLPFDLDAGHAEGRAEPVLSYRGKDLQMPVGVARGPDGLYVAPLFPVRDGRGAILKLRHDPANAHRFVIQRDDSPQALIAAKGCWGCHVAYDDAARVGPTLEPKRLVWRLQQRLSSSDYARSLREIDALDVEPYTTYRQAREQVARARGKEKVRLWLKYRLLEPRFDATASVMPNPELTEAEALRLADYFIDKGWTESPSQESSLFGRATKALPSPRRRHVAIAFVLGMVSAAGGSLLLRRRR